MLYTKNAHNAALPNIGLNELKSIADAAAGDATVDVGSDRRRKSSDRRVAALARRWLRQGRRGCLLLGTAATQGALLTQVSARVIQTHVSTACTSDCMCTAVAATAAAAAAAGFTSADRRGA